MTVSPEQLTRLPPEVWTRCASGKDTLLLRTGEPGFMFRLMPMAESQTTVGAFFEAMQAAREMDDEEMSAFERDVDEARRQMNQPLASPWDT